MKNTLKLLTLGLTVFGLAACGGNNSQDSSSSSSSKELTVLTNEQANQRLNGIIAHITDDDYKLSENITANMDVEALGVETNNSTGESITQVDIDMNASLGINLKDLVISLNLDGGVFLPIEEDSEKVEFDVALNAFIDNGKAIMAFDDGETKTYMETTIPAEVALFTQIDWTSMETIKTMISTFSTMASTGAPAFEIPEIDVAELETLTEGIKGPNDLYSFIFKSDKEGQLVIESNVEAYGIDAGGDDYIDAKGSAVVEIEDYRLSKYEMEANLTGVAGGYGECLDAKLGIDFDYETVVSKPSLDEYTKVSMIDFSSLYEIIPLAFLD